MSVDNCLEQKRIGIKIAFIRKLRGWDQEQLANEVGITRSYISKIENGNDINGVPMSIYLLIADAFDMPLWKLVKIDDD